MKRLALMALSSVAVLALACGSSEELSGRTTGSDGAGEVQEISPMRAIGHVGEEATVCGTIVDSSFNVDEEGQPTILSFGGPHPFYVFAAVIPGSDRHKFPTEPESFYRGHGVCVTGVISETSEFTGDDPDPDDEIHDIPQIIVRDPAQLEFR